MESPAFVSPLQGSTPRNHMRPHRWLAHFQMAILTGSPKMRERGGLLSSAPPGLALGLFHPLAT
jgi:hypothetical protein